MKKIVLITVILVCYNCAAQSPILPLDTRVYNRPHNSYLKDTQNQLAPFVGTWVFTHGNKKITIRFQKVMRYFNAGAQPHYYKDILRGLYKVEENGVVIYSDWDNPINNADIYGQLFSNDGHYLMSYRDVANCGITGRIKIKIDPNNSNRLIWEIPSSDLYPYDADIEEGECPQFLADPNFGRPMTLPYNMVLNKQ